MSAHVANAGLADGRALFDTAAADPLDSPPLLAAEVQEELSVVRGVVVAIIISIPFWLLFGFALYLLL